MVIVRVLEQGWGNRIDFTGVLLLLKMNGEWKCVAKATYAVRSDVRGFHVGEKLVCDCLEKAKDNGFSIIQFNAVVDSNIHARHLYEKLRFQEVGVIPGGLAACN